VFLLFFSVYGLRDVSEAELRGRVVVTGVWEYLGGYLYCIVLLCVCGGL
jgi:hypothetical protein